MASDYCYGTEMKRAVERHKRKEARVIPIILRLVYWQVDPVDKLQALPTGALPVNKWQNLDDAFFDIAEGTRKVAEEYKNRIHVAALAGKFQFSLSYQIEPIPSLNLEKIEPEIIPRGSRLRLEYHINNGLDMGVPVWLGADLRVDEQYFYDVEEDIDVLLQPGRLTYTRFLTIWESWPANNYYCTWTYFLAAKWAL